MCVSFMGLENDYWFNYLCGRLKLDDLSCLEYYLLYTMSGDGAQLLGTMEYDGTRDKQNAVVNLFDCVCVCACAHAWQSTLHG